ncbi:MAG: DUF1643 domain-containing protein [Leptolyngbya sp. SIOISBB]|nr:DUF1643 domain-containing protein [Leptolyngbya sp. SIOISBB]
MQRSAKFDETGQYRYWLKREWNAKGRAIALIMLNPSRADHRQDDPTLRRCISLAQQWQFSRLTVVNLFAYCTASPQTLKAAPSPVGQVNDQHILQACEQADQIALAWGNWGTLHQRDQAVLKLLEPFRDRLYCLGQNRTGQPRHPLYVPRHTQLQPWPHLLTDDSLSEPTTVKRSMAR